MELWRKTSTTEALRLVEGLLSECLGSTLNYKLIIVRSMGQKRRAGTGLAVPEAGECSSNAVCRASDVGRKC